MKATVDANILFAALIRDSATRHVWFASNLELFAPDFIVQEFLKHRFLVLEKSGADPKIFDQLLGRLLKKVALVADRELESFFPAAKSLCPLDPEDIRYFACALKEDTILWSQDRHFKQQRRIKVHTTAELLDQIGGLGK